MTHIETSSSIHRGVWFAAVTVLAGLLASSSLVAAQGSTDRAIDQAQRAVQERIISQQGGRDLTVQYARDAQTEFPSNAQVLVRGTGTVTRATDGRLRPFSYEAVVNTRSNRVIKTQYSWRGEWYSSGRSAVTNRLTGTYRLDPARSDNPATTARTVTRNLPAGEQERLRTAVERRLEAPESLAIERDGRIITIASSAAPRVTFEADGREQIEQSRNARQVRTTATLSGDRLVVSTDGDRAVDYQVTFESIDSGRSLRVTRRITHEDLRQAVVARSVYDKTSATPHWDVYARVRRGAGVSAADDEGGGFIVPNGTDMVAVLNDALSTRQARDGDRFALTVRTPSQYGGATIEGSLVHVARSGQVSGRAEMSFAFDAIRLRNGRVYDFTGYIESVRAPNDDAVRVDNEGVVQDDTGQAGRTVTRTGIGAAIGAVIGAVAGGGKGAAIGAAIGAGAGAGSVFIQGRSDLDLLSGTEFRIRASAPR
ncbi:MAG TPA: hypothetical protein VM818_16715 [Vicinamibacterales bacterium]|nr:hypothetical protein [Vicinamibacterales bacterium]